MDHDHTSVARLPSFTGPYPASETSTWLHFWGELKLVPVLCKEWAKMKLVSVAWVYDGIRSLLWTILEKDSLDRDRDHVSVYRLTYFTNSYPVSESSTSLIAFWGGLKLVPVL